ncbi:Integrin-alpha FG-GAP repeat-containing protein 2, partial [Trinorchestia longiramus]
MAAKQIAFTKPLSFKFEGNMFKNAITLGDVDNDSLNELVVGNDRGELAIFKGENPSPVRLATGIGLVSCIVVGDIANLSRNVLLVITSCGSCWIFDFLHNAIRETDERVELRAVHCQKLPANIKMALVGDISGDGVVELVVALTDRIVRTYKWWDSGVFVAGFPQGKLIAQNKWELSDQIGGIALNSGDGLQTLLVSQPGGACCTLNPPTASSSDLEVDENMPALLNKMSIELESSESSSCFNSNIQTEICGDVEVEEQGGMQQLLSNPYNRDSKSLPYDSTSSPGYVLCTADGLVMLVKDRKILWKCNVRHQILSLSQLLLPCRGKTDSTSSGSCSDPFTDEHDRDSLGESDESVCLDARMSPSLLKPTAVKSVPAMKAMPSTPSKLAIPIPNSKPKRLSNKKKYGQKLATKIVACSQDGTTSILNVRDGRCSQFLFHDNVCCCTSGFYGYQGMQTPCIVYIGYSDNIFLYHDVNSELKDKPKLMDELKSNLLYVEGLRQLGIEVDDREQVRLLNRYLMYGYDPPYEL